MAAGGAGLIVGLQRLEGLHWPTVDPFLFCAHHNDAYPRGNEELGPAVPLAGRQLGMDFSNRDGWSMYHGQVVPGFPQHPHRGFETVTIARRGHIDHHDSLGARARYGQGDVQWLTTGRGLSHSEMFPLLDAEGPNPVELFQIWLNLPRAKKLAPPNFSIFWKEQIPRQSFQDEAGRRTEVDLIAGRLGELSALPPPPDSWAARPEAEVAILTLRMEAGARWTLPAGSPGVLRTLYFFVGNRIRLSSLPGKIEAELEGRHAIALDPGQAATLEVDEASELLLLQGRPIGEPVAQYGPFVMNDRAELQQAFLEYQRTRFGGWPWERDDPVFPRGKGRFAHLIDGSTSLPPKAPQG